MNHRTLCSATSKGEIVNYLRARLAQLVQTGSTSFIEWYLTDRFHCALRVDGEWVYVGSTMVRLPRVFALPKGTLTGAQALEALYGEK